MSGLVGRQARPTFGSLFAGIGGFDAGLEAAGWRCRWQVEVDPFRRRVLAKHWPDVPRYDDVRNVDPAQLVPVDLITFGSPCQDLSVAGKRAGLSGARSGLFYEAIRIVRGVRPAFALWENVPGALSSHQGRDFAAVLDALADAGALDLCWRVLDSRWFGVPQRRRRIYLVADFGGGRAASVLFERESGGGHPAPRQEAGQGVAYCLAASPGGGRTGDDSDRTTYALTSRQTRLSAEDTLIRTAPVAFAWQQGDDSKHGKDGRGRSWVVRAGDYTGALSHTRQDAVAYGLSEQPTPKVGTGVFPTLDANRGGGGRRDAVSAGSAVRRLTPTEAERLQAFEDGWTCLCGVQPYSTAACRCPDSPRYAALGDAVTTSVMCWIGERLRRAMSQDTEEYVA